MGGGAPQGEQSEGRGRRDLLLFLLVLLLGFACLLVSAQRAIHLPSVWEVKASVLSEIDPDEEGGWAGLYFEPVRPEVMTPPPWSLDQILTPGEEWATVPPVELVLTPVTTETPQQAAAVPSASPLPPATATPPQTPTVTRTPLPTPTLLPSPTSTTTPTPLPSPTPTSTPRPPSPPTASPTPTPTRTPTPTPVAPPVIYSITPSWGQNDGDVQVVIQGANFFGLPSVILGVGLSVSVEAATADTITATVPAGSLASVYGLTVTNPDAQFAVLSPAYTVLDPPAPDTTLASSYLVTYGAEASAAEGDDDQVQIIFFALPDTCTDDLYFRVFDADTGGGGLLEDVDRPASLPWSTAITYTLRGYTGTYSYAGARQSHPGASGIGSGTVLSQVVVGDDSAYHGNWDLVFGPYQVSDGEAAGSYRVFKLSVEGAEGDDGNFYNVALSTDPASNTPPAHSLVFAYAWTFSLPKTVSERPALYPFAPPGLTTLEQQNWDMDYNGGGNTMTLHTPLRDLIVPGGGLSGNSAVFPDDVASSSHGVGSGESGATWTVTMSFQYPSSGNDITFWAAGDGNDLAIYTRPTTVSPP